ncbi:haloacid dehalogenase-like hydrolase [Streptomyces sp. S.PB5]|uniref:haloacid dehalogenase-like hydrolase n=1 Tax=Streptomyces sp. S.PB5 TaxID=3020844 RepID=UPI0025B21DC5|nr:haloacid dehalogenase-like hydrolase [Streptomyces sp. S.PB5]MDN3028436.1 haloacid dehalogenase-like hydrolase [Streptomyces sp. S.PB5]
MTDTPGRNAPVIAFFVIDQTLLSTRVLEDFLRHRLSERQFAYERGQLRALTALGIGPVDILRAHYRLYEGTVWTDLMEQGQHWYDDLCRGRQASRPFIPSAVAALHAHQEAGHLTVLLSEAFAPCLTPLGKDLGADLVMGTEPLLDAEGRLTGAVHRPMTAAAKARAARTTAAAHGADLHRCFGYGGHADALALLRTVGRPSVIGTDPVLTTHARRSGWPILPSATST